MATNPQLSRYNTFDPTSMITAQLYKIHIINLIETLMW